MDDEGTVNRFAEKAKEDGGWINGGFMVLEPQVLDYIDGDATFLKKSHWKDWQKKISWRHISMMASGNVWIHCGIKKHWIIYGLLIGQNGRNGNKEKENGNKAVRKRFGIYI